ncbi:MAG: PRC-barrel domain-containing protein [Candidatus Marinimicrobia bacterium]|nr:PRC-barrel domain-containing protein [Candidatus Neomarinimicrobiota bacterium]
MSDNNKNLYYLEELSDYKVASDYYDVRGWDVIDAENRTIGKVTNLLVNKQAERVVYLDVEVDESLIEVGYNTYQVSASDGVHGFLNKEGDEHLIVPIGMVNLNKEQKKVLTNQIDYNTFVKARRFNRGAEIDRDYELIMFRHYIHDDTIDIAILDDGFYNRKEFENSLHRNDA